MHAIRACITSTRPLPNSVSQSASASESAGERDRLRIAGLLHDVGKIGISDAILGKPGTLATHGRAEIEPHATTGHSVLTVAGLTQEAVWILHDHERFDGNGYPAALAGTAIPVESRVICVADAFEAMTATRPYAPRRDAVDPQCVRALCDVFGAGGLPHRPSEAGTLTAARAVA